MHKLKLGGRFHAVRIKVSTLCAIQRQGKFSKMESTFVDEQNTSTVFESVPPQTTALLYFNIDW